MQIVIDIKDEIHRDCKELGSLTVKQVIEAEKAIKNGTPLPKGHGELVDKSKITKAMPAEEDNLTGCGMTIDEMDAYNDGIDAMYYKIQTARVIVKADKEDEK